MATTELAWKRNVNVLFQRVILKIFAMSATFYTNSTGLVHLYWTHQLEIAEVNTRKTFFHNMEFPQFWRPLRNQNRVKKWCFSKYLLVVKWN